MAIFFGRPPSQLLCRPGDCPELTDPNRQYEQGGLRGDIVCRGIGIVGYVFRVGGYCEIFPLGFFWCRTLFEFAILPRLGD